MSKESLTPKQVARALDVSESSVKRWCDRGVIPALTTPGGHRRIEMSDLVRFLRTSGRSVVDPSAIGLPVTVGQSPQVIQRAADNLCQALLAGEEAAARQIVFDLYLGKLSMATICDQVIATAFHTIGERWHCGEAEVYQERRGCEICFRVLHELRRAQPEPTAEAPLALGATPSGDPYGLSTTMAELVLRDAGWRAVSLGSNLPLVSLRVALTRHHPRLFWLSVSHIADEQAFLDDLEAFYAAKPADVAVVVGGQALTPELRQRMSYSAHCDTMRHLAEFAGTLAERQLTACNDPNCLN
ncbi:MAG: helix-turn-helix domain-containing protein [Pirellulaceae bacterium]